jgi:hypothetical protein
MREKLVKTCHRVAASWVSTRKPVGDAVALVALTISRRVDTRAHCIKNDMHWSEHELTKCREELQKLGVLRPPHPCFGCRVGR